ncbi:MAG: hypothetical protein K1W37_07735 [Lachnospiraceae bacterium]
MQIQKSELTRKIDKLKSVVSRSSNIVALQGICVCGEECWKSDLARQAIATGSGTTCTHVLWQQK